MAHKCVHVMGEPGRPAVLHACLDWVCAVKGVGALSQRRGVGTDSDKASLVAQSLPSGLGKAHQWPSGSCGMSLAAATKPHKLL